MNKSIEQLFGDTDIKTTAYHILNKDEVLYSFVWEEDTDEFLSIRQISSFNKLPKFIMDSVVGWIKSRTPPKHREHMDTLLKSMGLTTVKSIIDYSKGLSLTDTFWITNSLSLHWKDVNLFNNRFDEVVSQIAFDGGLYGMQIKTTSPEFGTNGMLPKCWIRDDTSGSITLKKGGTAGARNSGNEPYSEVLSSQVLDVLGYNHVPYNLESFRGRVVSSCPLFTTEKVMMVPIFMMCNISTVENIVSYCESVGIADDLYRTFIFDYLTNNSDRHGNNFAVLLDSDTYEILGMAPIYDNGCAMLCYYTAGDNLSVYLKNYIPALYDSYDALAKVSKRRLKSQHNVNKLINFKFDRTRMLGYSDAKIDIIEDLIQKRVQKFLSW